MDHKNCPYCGEEIAATAKKCRFCGEWLEEPQQPIQPDPQPQSPQQVYQSQPQPNIATEKKFFPKPLVTFLIIVSVLGLSTELLEILHPKLEEFNEIAEIIGSILSGVGICTLFILFVWKNSADRLPGVSNGLLMTTGILYALMSVISCFDNDGLIIISGILFLATALCWAIGSIQLMMIEELRKTGLWMLLSILIATAIQIYFGVTSASVSSKGMGKLLAFVYLGGYVMFFQNLSKYLTDSKQ